jgi:hypothetical protein
MIIDDAHRAAFIHVPKCGGTSVSLQLLGEDAQGGRFRQKGVHPELGPIHYAHLPLRFLRDYFPDIFAKVVSYQSFALTRDPHDRFASAIFQRLEEFCGVSKIEITGELAVREARRVMEWVQQRDEFCDLEYIHFSRQIDYICLDGEVIVKNVFRLDDLAGLAEAMSRLCGITIDADRRENINFASNNRALALIHRLKPIYSRLTPWSLRERLLFMMKDLKLQNPDKLYDILRDDSEISGFVREYYSADLELYKSVAGRTSRAGRPTAVGRDAAPAMDVSLGA